uniref:Uncharacterized protein n=1 Tax=Anguilla anguilla TaxID=7936 RepID=A0A0E9PR78_ANGAN
MNITVSISEADSLFFVGARVWCFFFLLFFTPKTAKTTALFGCTT